MKKKYRNDDNKNLFSKQIDEILNGIYPKRDMLIVSERTPKILKEIGLKDLPITLTQKHFYTKKEADKNDNIIVVSIKIEVKGQITDINIDSNVMTSAYGISNNYDRFMKDNISRGNLLYDID